MEAQGSSSVATFDTEFAVRLIPCCSVDPTRNQTLHHRGLHTRFRRPQRAWSCGVKASVDAPELDDEKQPLQELILCVIFCLTSRHDYEPSELGRLTSKHNYERSELGRKQDPRADPSSSTETCQSQEFPSQSRVPVPS